MEESARTEKKENGKMDYSCKKVPSSDVKKRVGGEKKPKLSAH